MTDTSVRKPAATAPLALYIHWPFCQTKCPYCDFNSHVRPGIDDAAWEQALLRDLAHEARGTQGARLVSIFFGGGTPSLMPPRLAASLIAAATRAWRTAPDLEITLEANPSSVEAARFADFRAAGVNRLSLGLQALDDAALRLLGRPHDLAQGLAALDLAQRTFPRVSFDLIHSRPGQTAAAWETELARALGFGTGHLSAYQLTIEPGTRFATLAARGLLDLPCEEEAASMFEATAALAAAAGLNAYEISNHARPGEESRHNLAYWTYAPFAGVGPGAHGRRQGRATVRVRRPEAWLEAVAKRGHGIESETVVPAHEAAREALVMGLRLARGIDPDLFRERTGLSLDRAVDPHARARLEALGLLAPGPSLRATAAGRPVLDRLLAELAREPA
jgi:oxygen-independent coproporphyrinogen-3 oxidase